jgi:hypothetical protein
MLNEVSLKNTAVCPADESEVAGIRPKGAWNFSPYIVISSFGMLTSSKRDNGIIFISIKRFAHFHDLSISGILSSQNSQHPIVQFWIVEFVHLTIILIFSIIQDWLKLEFNSENNRQKRNQKIWLNWKSRVRWNHSEESQFRWDTLKSRQIGITIFNQFSTELPEYTVDFPDHAESFIIRDGFDFPMCCDFRVWKHTLQVRSSESYFWLNCEG